jgi:2-polyprenyl-3-methyl-5-hydroxy-6-metoxy-1,4-benzoquinol methylase
MRQEPNEHQDFERNWWGTCANTYGEEAKQTVYATLMGIEHDTTSYRYPTYKTHNKKILDLGGGPTSILLKCENIAPGTTVVDPCDYPNWVKERYKHCGINYIQKTAEEYKGKNYDEVWIYNVLQHVENPKTIIENAKKAAPKLRIFDWLETQPTIGHPHTLHADELNDWIGATGQVGYINENGCVGLAYYGELTF